MKTLLLCLFSVCTAISLAEGLMDRWTGESSPHGAVTLQFNAPYQAAVLKGISIKGAGITNGVVVSRITAGGVFTQTVATVQGTGAYTASLTAPYLIPGDTLVFTPDPGNQSSSTSYVYCVDVEIQRR